MKAASRDRRRDEILDLAIEVLAERGYRDASMLEIAKRAAASKETLYAWFGDKQGLFEAAIRRNAETVQGVLQGQLESDAPPERTLPEFGRALLALLLGDSAVAINRAAIAEVRAEPRLAETLARAGRDATLPAFLRYLERQQERGLLQLDAGPEEAAEVYLGLLLGDRQVRRLLGRIPAPTKKEIDARAAIATTYFLQLYGTSAGI